MIWDDDRSDTVIFFNINYWYNNLDINHTRTHTCVFYLASLSRRKSKIRFNLFIFGFMYSFVLGLEYKVLHK